MPCPSSLIWRVSAPADPRAFRGRECSWEMESPRWIAQGSSALKNLSSKKIMLYSLRQFVVGIYAKKNKTLDVLKREPGWLILPTILSTAVDMQLIDTIITEDSTSK